MFISSGVPVLVLKSKDSNRGITTSLFVAKVFGKRHADVLRDIREFNCFEDFCERNFALIELQEVTHSPVVQNKYYEITKDGFSFLVMIYTEEKASQFIKVFKLSYEKYLTVAHYQYGVNGI